ncbi:MAG: hypothetical protein HY840_04305 [Bacteroidetes bacterium]|nr:hypothetical protein [Bacteroidota bacterium]
MSREKEDTLLYSNAVKLDFIPLYDVAFDSRFQIRIGLEYEKYISKNSSSTCYLDAGLYDRYDFIKYYGFFSQNQGMYSIQQRVSVTGFHLLPGYNYYFYTFRRNQNRRFFSSAVLDFGYYHKILSSLNTLTSVTEGNRYSQMKFGAGIGLGFKNSFGKHLFYELKTSMFAKLYNYISESGRNSIRSLDAQWTSPNYNFWWISNIKIGYAF